MMSRGKLVKTTIREFNKALNAGETTVSEVCQQSFNLIEASRGLNAFITLCKDAASDNARLLDQEIYSSSKGKSSVKLGNLLHGVPISIKDNFCTNQILTTCGSKMLHNFIPPYTATAVSKLLKAKCVMVGKTNMDEFAMGSSSTTSFYGPSANNWMSEQLSDDKTPKDSPAWSWFMAGGSSTGSAVSVSTGTCFASLGTDTGGSTRQPASLTGVVGFKPTYGLVSRFGLVPLVHSLDVVSVLARTVDDTRLVFEAIIGQDENDLTSVDAHSCLRQPAAWTSLVHDKQSGNSSRNDLKNLTLRIGIPEEFISRGNVSSEVSHMYDRALNLLKSSQGINFQLVKISLPNSTFATECYTVMSSAEIASNMSCYDGVRYGLSTPLPPDVQSFNRDNFFQTNRDEGFGAEVKKRILLGNYFLLNENREKYLVQALKVRRMISEEYAKAFEGPEPVDFILMPSTPTTSVTHEEWLQKNDDNRLFHEDYFLIPSNLANLPSISLPAGLSKRGLPTGLQLVANRFDDFNLLSFSHYLEAKLSEMN